MSGRITAASTHIIVVDIQQKLAPHLHDASGLIANTVKLLTGAALFDIPITIAEQYPQGLGESVPELHTFINNNRYTKTSFSCFGSNEISSVLKDQQKNDRTTLVVLGCEAHVCVLQTVLDALENSFRVIVVADAVASRHPNDKNLAQSRLMQAGAEYVSTEMVLFEWTQGKDDKRFKEISALVK